jgi:Zn-dependent peptidase ImmA (M78 family)
MTRVAVKESVLRWALTRSNTSADALRDRFPKIHDWLSGIAQPTFKQLEALAQATTTPFGLLFLDAPPDESLPIPDYRTTSDKKVRRPSANLFDTIQIMQRRQDWMREYLIDMGESPLPFVGSAKVDDPAKNVAASMRAVLGFEADWARRHFAWDEALRALREAMERAGILVVANSVVGNNTSRALDPEEFRGFVLIDQYAPLVFVNSADAKSAQMFTLAHELAHVFFGSSAVFDLRHMMPAPNEVEQACNSIAAEFLVPEHLLRKEWEALTTEGHTKIYGLAKQFKVSPIVAARRALDLKLVNRQQFGGFYTSHMTEEHQRRPAKGGDFYASQDLRIGRRFASAVVRAVKEGRILYSDAYSLTGLRGSTFEKFAEGIEV